MGRPSSYNPTPDELETLARCVESGVTADRAAEALGWPTWLCWYVARYKLGRRFGAVPPDKARAMGDRLRLARADKGLTILEAEDATGVSHVSIGAYELGRRDATRAARWDIIKTLAACYGVTPEWIIGEED